MADLLALTRRDDEAVAASVRTGGTPSVGRTVRVALAGGGDAAAVRAALAAAKVGAKRTVLALPRSAVSVRRLSLPAVPDHELPDLVRMQAATKSSVPVDQLALDFLPQPPGGHDVGVAVRLATVARKTLDSLAAMARDAGLEPVAAGMTGVGAAELFLRRDPPAEGELRVGIVRDGPRAEIVITSGRHLVQSHSAEPHGDDPAADRRILLADVSRTLVALEHLDRPNLSAAAVCGGPDPDALAAALTERFGCPAAVVRDWADVGLSGDGADPADLPALFGPVGCAVGSDAAAGATVGQLDFLHPRRPPEPVDHRRRNALLAAAAAVVIAGGGYWWWSGTAAGLDGRIAILDAENAAAQELLDRVAPTVTQDAALTAWRADADDPLAELAAVDRLLPGTDRIVLSDFELTPGNAVVRARLRLAGTAVDEATVREFERRLDRDGYVLTRTTADPARDGGGYRFEVAAELPPAKAAGPATSVAPSTAACTTGGTAR